jgi:hypothetical protein
MIEGRSRADLAQTLVINRLVKRAAAAGEQELSPSGKPYRHVPIEIFQSPEPLGDTVDFRRSILNDRWDLGLEVARKQGPELIERYRDANAARIRESSVDT